MERAWEWSDEARDERQEYGPEERTQCALCGDEIICLAGSPVGALCGKCAWEAMR